jgi:hypothetical protein
MARNTEIVKHPNCEWDGHRIVDHGESWVDYATFDTSFSDEEIMAALAYPDAYYNGPGRAFSHGPVIKRGKFRTLVLWPHGLDI